MSTQAHSSATEIAPENVRVSPAASPAQFTVITLPKKENVPNGVALDGLYVSHANPIASVPPPESVTEFDTEHDTLIAGHHSPSYFTTGSGAKISG